MAVIDMVSKERIEQEEKAFDEGRLSELSWTEDELRRIDREPGKFQGEPQLAKVLYELMMLNSFDDSVDDWSGGAWYKFDGVLLVGIPSPIYAILEQHNDGLLFLDEYPSKERLESAWKSVDNLKATEEP